MSGDVKYSYNNKERYRIKKKEEKLKEIEEIAILDQDNKEKQSIELDIKKKENSKLSSRILKFLKIKK